MARLYAKGSVSLRERILIFLPYSQETSFNRIYDPG